MIQSAANLEIHTLVDFLFGSLTKVMLNKTCGSLKAINSSLQSEIVVYTAVQQRNPDFTTAPRGLVVCLFDMS